MLILSYLDAAFVAISASFTCFDVYNWFVANHSLGSPEAAHFT